jgi:hypothetical protein
LKQAGMVLLFSLALYSAALLSGKVVEKRSVPVDFNQRYMPIAHNILDRGDFLLEGRAPSPPVYPLVLAGLSKLGSLFGINATNIARAFNILAMALLSGLFFSLVRKYTNERTALIAALIWITYPFGIYLALQPGPEPLYLLALLPAAWTALEAGSAKPLPALTAGMAGSLPMLVKPMALFLPLAMLGVLMFWWLKQRVFWMRFVLACSLFVVGLLAAVMPWEAYLWQRTGRFIPVAELAGSSLYDGWTFGLKPGAGGDRARLPGDVEKYMQEVEKLSMEKASGEVLKAVRISAGKHTGAFIKLLLIKIGRCWYGTDEMWHEVKTLAIQALYLVLSLVGAIIWFRRGRPGGALAAVLAVLLLYHWAAATAALSILRYMIPAFFLMSMMVSFLLHQLSVNRFVLISAAGRA